LDLYVDAKMIFKIVQNYSDSQFHFTLQSVITAGTKQDTWIAAAAMAQLQLPSVTFAGTL